MQMSKEQLEKIAQCHEEVNQYINKCMNLLADIALKSREIEKIIYKLDD